MATAVITGASTGLGSEFAHICAADGYDLILIARSADQLQALSSEVQSKTGRRVQVIVKDLAKPEAPTEIMAEIGTEISNIEVVINNAGVGMLGFFSEMDTNAQMQMLQLNVNALTHLTRLLLPELLRKKRGWILNVASTAAFQPGPLMAVYYASKAYVLSLSEALHHELRDQGVVVTVLCPGPTKTEFQRRASMEKTKLFGGRNVMNAREVAQIGYNAMKAGRSSVTAGTLNRLVAFSTRFAPRQFTAAIARRLQEQA